MDCLESMGCERQLSQASFNSLSVSERHRLRRCSSQGVRVSGSAGGRSSGRVQRQYHGFDALLDSVIDRGSRTLSFS